MTKNNVQLSDGRLYFIPETKSKGIWEYYDPDDQDFIKQTGNWVQISELDSTIYKTPMDSYHYVSSRKPISTRPGGYIPNFLKDSIVHREDIMTRHSRVFNKNSYNSNL
jgi:hypothetical protein